MMLEPGPASEPVDASGLLPLLLGRAPRADEGGDPSLPVAPAPITLHASPATGEAIGEGARNATLASLGGSMRRRGMVEEEILAALRVVNAGRCRPPLGDAEVARIAASVARYQSPGRPSFLDALGDPGRKEEQKAALVRLWEVERPRPRQWRVTGLVPEGAVTIIYGDGGRGKSLLVLYLCTAVALGREVLGLPAQRRPVLYVDAELSWEEQARRAYAVAAGLGLTRPPEGLFYYRLPGPLGHPEVRAAVRAMAVESQAGLVALDSLTVAAAGSDINAAADVTALMRDMEDWGTVVAIDHVPKPQPGVSASQYRPFGSAFKYHMARSLVYLGRAPDGVMTLYHIKSSFGATLDPLRVKATFSSDGVQFEHAPYEAGDVREAALGPAKGHSRTFLQLLAANAPISTAALAAELGLSEKTVSNHLWRLKAEGRAVREGRHAWRAVDDQAAA